MTVSSVLTRVAYSGDGVTAAFPVPFSFLNASDLEVIQRTIATGAESLRSLSTHYTVSGGGGGTGTVTAVVPPSVAVQWIIRRNTAPVQLTDYTPHDPFPAETHERAIDRITMRAQELGEELARALKLPKTDSASLGVTLPSSVERAGKYLKFGAAGEPVAANELLTGALTVSAFIQSFLDDVNATAARATLGLTIGSDVLAPDGSGSDLLNIVKQGKHTIWVPAGAMTRLTTGTPCGSLTTFGTAFGQYDGLPFADATIQQAGFWVAMPKSWDHQSTIEIVPVWSVDGAATGDVAWRARINARGDGDNIGGAYDSSPNFVIDSAGGVQGRMLVGASILATGPITGASESDLLFVVVERVGTDTLDTLTTSAILRGVKILYSINKSRDN
jgi:hypothetical protein